MLGEKGGNYKGLEKGQGWMMWVLTDGACKEGAREGLERGEDRGKKGGKGEKKGSCLSRRSAFGYPVSICFEKICFENQVCEVSILLKQEMQKANS